MRPRHVLVPLALALVVRTIVRAQRRRRARRASEGIQRFRPDPTDPLQRLDEVPELEVAPLSVDAVSAADVAAAEDLAILEDELDQTADRDTAVIARADADETAVISETMADDDGGDEPAHERDAGDLYGAHTPPAQDREHPDNDRSFDTGENWLEALEASAAENGPEPERELDDVVDDEDVLQPPHPSDTRDRPVADLGSGGRAGL
jgi:hypothetical protein